MDYAILASALLLGSIAGYVFGIMRGKQLLAGAVSRSQYDALMQEKTTLSAKLQTSAESLEQNQRERTAFHERAITAEANNKALEQQLKEQQAQLRTQFENTANTIFKTISTDFSTQSEKKIGDLLSPVQKHLNEFKELVAKSFSDHGKEQYSLKAEIEKFIKTSETMRLETGNLAKAIRGDVKAQGNWGEIMLERILEASGLRKGIEYTVQASELGLTSDDGSRQKPDVIIHLPENKHIIIDSKVSLKAYERYCNEIDESLKDSHLKELLKSIKSHIHELSEKRYQDIKKLAAPDSVFMFMPIEGAFSVAVQHDTELHSYAWEKHIVLVCPNILFAMLQTIASLWRIERQNKNADKIAYRGGRLYEEFERFLRDIKNIGDALKTAQESYDSAFNRLRDGRASLVKQVEELKTLGAKTAKSLPKEFLEDDEPAALPLLAEG